MWKYDAMKGIQIIIIVLFFCSCKDNTRKLEEYTNEHILHSIAISEMENARLLYRFENLKRENYDPDYLDTSPFHQGRINISHDILKRGKNLQQVILDTLSLREDKINLLNKHYDYLDSLCFDSSSFINKHYHHQLNDLESLIHNSRECSDIFLDELTNDQKIEDRVFSLMLYNISSLDQRILRCVLNDGPDCSFSITWKLRLFCSADSIDIGETAELLLVPESQETIQAFHYDYEISSVTNGGKEISFDTSRLGNNLLIRCQANKKGKLTVNGKSTLKSDVIFLPKYSTVNFEKEIMMK